MELRSHSNYKKSNMLEIKLRSLGMYEQGMKMEEMCQIMQALQESEQEDETAFLESDMERAIKESELDFAQMQREAHSSTMMDLSDGNANILKPQYSFNARHNGFRSPFSSPELPSKTFTLQAEVHHAYDWSPPKQQEDQKPDTGERAQRKRLGAALCSHGRPHLGQNVKRFCLPPLTPISPLHSHSGDSGIFSTSGGSSTEASLEDTNGECNGAACEQFEQMLEATQCEATF